MDKNTMRAELAKLRQFRFLVLCAYASGPLRRFVALPSAIDRLVVIQDLDVAKITTEPPNA